RNVVREECGDLVLVVAEVVEDRVELLEERVDLREQGGSLVTEVLQRGQALLGDRDQRVEVTEERLQVGGEAREGNERGRELARRGAQLRYEWIRRVREPRETVRRDTGLRQEGREDPEGVRQLGVAPG